MSFDALALHYRWMERVLAGEKLQRARLAFVDCVRDTRRVLLVGEGHGRFLEECVRAFPGANLTVVDESARMLSVARSGVEKENRARAAKMEFIHSDVLQWTPPARAFDLIVTNFFLDCFPESLLPSVIQKLSAAASSQARWLIADFQIPSNGLARRRAKLIHATMYLFFRMATRLPARRWIDPDPFLRAEGFLLGARTVSEWGLIRSDCWHRS
jgi:ubiquinone/menaquinone biosynthesis C-methylase UbiE